MYRKFECIFKSLTDPNICTYSENVAFSEYVTSKTRNDYPFASFFKSHYFVRESAVACYCR